ncbi:hypothetical protein [Pontibacter sp. G13]|uniref:hypothetical protein n=1 Tax=Pontibacter sp. G13 TaxID=3074898 RepID=UPI0028898E03|nr:hypothetical protein [Pontibacter sp. G13]WNJ15930.1 hypothetical protein RJD25_13785 [Pontibacter sp. G13]
MNSPHLNLSLDISLPVKLNKGIVSGFLHLYAQSRSSLQRAMIKLVRREPVQWKVMEPHFREVLLDDLAIEESMIIESGDQIKLPFQFSIPKPNGHKQSMPLGSESLMKSKMVIDQLLHQKLFEWEIHAEVVIDEAYSPIKIEQSFIPIP